MNVDIFNTDKKYNIIYADPPWTYPKTGGKKNSRGMAKQFYNTMSIEEIKSIPIKNITAENAILWEDDHGDYVCSCCHTVFTDDLVWLVRGESNEPNYCPHCGAKMMPQPPKGE
jgi:DNA-directed RNA polymerase subunit RPC12/RpoP